MKILVIKPSSFGDIIQANPTLTALKRAYPDAAFHWLVFDSWAGILSLFPDIDAPVIWERKRGIRGYAEIILRLRKERYDIALDLQGLLRTTLLASLSGARKKLGAPGLKECGGLFIKEAFPESASLNAVYRSLETVRFLTGKKEEPVFRLAVPASAEKDTQNILERSGINTDDRIIALVPFTRGATKQWPLRHFRQLADLLFSRYKGIRITAFGSRGNAGLLQHPQVIDLCGHLSIVQLAAAFKRCRAVIGGDTGPVHLAAALNVPVVMLFGGSDMRETAPVSGKAVVLSKNMPCSPCRSHPRCVDFPCLGNITPQEVFEKIEGIPGDGV